MFAIRIDNEELDENLKGKDTERNRIAQSEPIISTVIPCTSGQEHQKKKIPIHIISFDNDEEVNECKDNTTSISAPATYLNSPRATSTKDSTSPSLPVSQSQVDPNDSTAVNMKFTEWEQWYISFIMIEHIYIQDGFSIYINSFSHYLILFHSESFEEEKILTPVTDSGNMRSLVPVSSLDQTLDDVLVTLPNYLDVSIHSINMHFLQIMFIYDCSL